MKWWVILLIVGIILIICVWLLFIRVPVKEGFQTWEVDDPRWFYTDYFHTPEINSRNTGTSYTIFDPTAAYVQADIYSTEYQSFLTNIYSIDSNFTRNILPTLLVDNTKDDYNNWPDYKSDKPTYNFSNIIINQDVYRNIANYLIGTNTYPTWGENTLQIKVEGYIKKYAENRTHISNMTTDPKIYYKTRDLNFMKNYNFSNTFKNNPLRFIWSNLKPNGSYINCGYKTLDHRLYDPKTDNGVTIRDNLYRIISAYAIRGFELLLFGAETSPSLRFNINDKSTCLPVDFGWFYNKNCTIAREETYECAPFQGEVDYPSIDRGIIKTPQNWAIKTFFNKDAVPANCVQGVAAAQKIKSDFETEKRGQHGGQLYKTIPVIGTVSPTNITEIQNSVRHSMFFNFTDTSTTEQQINISLDLPIDLYFFPDLSGISEFYSFMGRVTQNEKAIKANRNTRLLLTNSILKVLPYHTRTYIIKWAKSRTIAIGNYYKTACDTSTKGLDPKWKSLIVAQQAGPILSAILSVCCSTQAVNSQVNILGDNYKCNEPNQFKDVFGQTAEVRALNTYNAETYNVRTYDVQPAFDLMSQPPTVPPVYTVRSSTEFIPDFRVYVDPNVNPNRPAVSNRPTNYTVTFQVGLVNFLTQKNISVIVKSSSDSTTFFQGDVESYTSTTTASTVTLYNISVGAIVNKGVLTSATSSPPTLIKDYYIVSYTDNSQQTINDYETIYPVKITPISGTTVSVVDLPLPYQVVKGFSTATPNNTVTVTNISDASVSFDAIVTDIRDNTELTITTYKLTPIATTIQGDYNPIAKYFITKTTGTKERYWLSTQEKSIIMNMIAQKFYDLNNGENTMYTILDLYQVGDTLFDVRFLELRRNTSQTVLIQQKMRTLYNNYKLYRTYNLSEDQLLELDYSYSTNMVQLNSDLDNAIQGSATDCGIKAQYVKIQRTDPSSTGIQISQVVVIDNTGDNVAYNSLVSASSTRVYVYENQSVYSYVTPPNYSIIKSGANAGAIQNDKGEVDPRGPAPGTCCTVSGSTCVANPICIEESGTVFVMAPTRANGDTAEVSAIKYNRRQSLVDGILKQRVDPYHFATQGASINEYVQIDLGVMMDITNVQLIFPLLYSETPTYKITFLNSSEQDVTPTGINNSQTVTRTAVANGSTPYANQNIMDFGDTFLKPENKHNAASIGLQVCPIASLNPFKVARFYASYTGYEAGKPWQNIKRLSFTGYSIGTEAALTFNPMYNAGFTMNTAAGSGNMNYTPTIQYTIRTGDIPLVNMGSLCSDRNSLINIIRDYQSSIFNPIFALRPDVGQLSTPYNLVEYVYHPVRILKAADVPPLGTGQCAIHWQEYEVNPVTNLRTLKSDGSGPKLIDRYGIFKYVQNLKNWGAIDGYYDVKNSRMYDTIEIYNQDKFVPDRVNPPLVALNPEIPMIDILPFETTLDTAGDRCPSSSCSEINIINQLVSEYNQQNKSAQILRVTKAVTATSTRCDYRVFMESSSSVVERNVTFNISVSATNKSSSDLQLSTTECSYKLESWDITGGQFIQENTPTILYIYNYANEQMLQYKTRIAGIYDELMGYLNTATINNDFKSYFYDTLGAYGQIKDLSGCKPTDTGKKCTDIAVMTEFIKAYNNLNRSTGKLIQSITHGGTSSDTTCDYLISVSQINSLTYGTGVTANLSENGTSELWRATMIKAMGECYFTVNTNVSNYLNKFDLSRSVNDILTTMQPIPLPVTANQTPWTTPTTIATQKTKQTISVVAGQPVYLSVPPVALIGGAYPPYITGTAVTVVDTNNSQNYFKSVISGYSNTARTSVTPPYITLTPILAANIAGTFNTPTIYTVLANPIESPNLPPTIANPIETLDYVDCNVCGSILSPRIALKNIAPFTCENSNTNTKYTCTNYNSPPAITSVVNNRFTTSLPQQIATTAEITVAPQNIDQIITNLYSTTYATSMISPDTYEIRINRADTLQFTDTYKIVKLWNINGVPRIKEIRETSISTSKFAFFYINPVENVKDICLNAARDKWNSYNSTASVTVNKSIIGNISHYYYDINTDSITFQATACDFGIHGATDIRKYSTSRYFNATFRQMFERPTAIYSSTDPTGNSIIVYSIIEVDSIQASKREINNIYTSRPENREYTIQSLMSAFNSSHSFRHLRFRVLSTPLSASQTKQAAEITQIHFYAKQANGLLPENPPSLPFNYASYSVDNISVPYYYTNTDSTDVNVLAFGLSDTPAIINPSNPSVVINNANGTFNESTTLLMQVLVYDYNDPSKYFTGTLQSVVSIKDTVKYTITIKNITIPTTTPPMSFTQSAYYAVVQNGCKTGYSVESDVRKVYYQKCNLNILKSSNVPYPQQYSFNTASGNIRTPGANENINLPCGIGYDLTIVGPLSVCNANGNFSAVNMELPFLNAGTPRLKLDIGQNFYINLNQTVKIDYYTITTGTANSRPQSWVLEGSMTGSTRSDEWVIIDTKGATITNGIPATCSTTQNSCLYQYPEAIFDTSAKNKIYSFVTTNYFPVFGGPAKNNNNDPTTVYAFINDPTTTSSTPTFESFKNPTILDTPEINKFKRTVPKLNNFYSLTNNSPEIMDRMPVEKRRIQYLRFKILDTRDPTSKFTHMSNLQFVTPLGPLPIKHYKISNPMGNHPIKGTGPDALNNGRWMNTNKHPLLIKFQTLPVVSISGFQFSVPQTANPYGALPASWIIEASYDGRAWTVYHEEDNSNFMGTSSPVYKFVKEI